MIDKNIAIDKSKKKESARFGISIVNMVGSLNDIHKDIAKLKQEKLLYNDRFIWNKGSNLHITLLRCQSVHNPIEVPDEYWRYLHELFCKKCEFSLRAEELSLDQDGVIRLHLGTIPTKFWDGINISELCRQTGLNYTVIYKPWISLAYSKIDAIDKICRDYEAISDLLNMRCREWRFIIKEVAAVKYSDTSFKAKCIETMISLGGTYGF